MSGDVIVEGFKYEAISEPGGAQGLRFTAQVNGHTVRNFVGVDPSVVDDPAVYAVIEQRVRREFEALVVEPKGD